MIVKSLIEECVDVNQSGSEIEKIIESFRIFSSVDDTISLSIDEFKRECQQLSPLIVYSNKLNEELSLYKFNNVNSHNLNHQLVQLLIKKVEKLKEIYDSPNPSNKKLIKTIIDFTNRLIIDVRGTNRLNIPFYEALRSNRYLDLLELGNPSQFSHFNNPSRFSQCGSDDHEIVLSNIIDTIKTKIDGVLDKSNYRCLLLIGSYALGEGSIQLENQKEVFGSDLDIFLVLIWSRKPEGSIFKYSFRSSHPHS
ncbi:MAG: hypothetical protein GY730_00485 [bacterium]|nr:hypothetical protein [bacterium]